MEGSTCVRKGAWCKVEDDLLRACVQQYGEGKWHLVPARADNVVAFIMLLINLMLMGLNRCRKSCRLRWLNYLKPNIKRGEFAEDEVDLMQRLHKLLGNRWSLIAGRLPGRTPNDVKNYWNTYTRRKESSHKVVKVNEKEEEIVKPHVVIKPRARTISRSSPWLKESVIRREGESGANKQYSIQACEANSLECNNWWETMMDDNQDGIEKLLEDINCDENNLTSLTLQEGDFLIEGENWSDFLSLI